MGQCTSCQAIFDLKPHPDRIVSDGLALVVL